MACSGLPEKHATVIGLHGILQEVHSQFCWPGRTTCCSDRKGRPIRLFTLMKTGTLSGLSCFAFWGSFGPDPHVVPSKSPVLLVGYG